MLDLCDPSQSSTRNLETTTKTILEPAAAGWLFALAGCHLSCSLGFLLTSERLKMSLAPEVPGSAQGCPAEPGAAQRNGCRDTKTEP